MYILNIAIGSQALEIAVRFRENVAYMLHLFEHGGDVPESLTRQIGKTYVNPGQVVVTSLGYDMNQIDLDDCANDNLGYA